MEKHIRVFNNTEFGEIRTMEIGGEPWFVGKDVATALGYSKCRISATNDHHSKEVRTMWIYAIIVTIIAIILIVKMIKWKIAFQSITLFCVENFREPTDEEIADCSKRTVSKMFKAKG